MGWQGLSSLKTKITITILMNYEKIFKDDSIIKEHELY